MNTIKCGIYRITNLINGKVYIGQSKNIRRRWKEHRNRYNRSSDHQHDCPLYKAMRKYGLQNFQFNIECLCSPEELDVKEIEYIEKYSSYKEDRGYNLTLGGYTHFKGNKITKEQAQGIIELLKNPVLSQTDIAKEYNVTQQLISSINIGESWSQPNVSYPIRKRNEVQIKKSQIIKEKQSKLTNICKVCGKTIPSKQKYCSQKCAHFDQRKVKNRPTKEQLELLVKDNSFESLGRQLGVTGKAVKKWCETYGIDYRKIRK